MTIHSEPVWPSQSPTEINSLPDTSFRIQTSPSLLTGLFVQFLRAHFATADTIVDEALKGYLWTDDATTTRIMIEPAYSYNNKDVQRRPAILINRMDYNIQYPGLGDGSHITHLEHAGSKQAGKHTGSGFSAILTGTHQIASIGQTGIECERLAEEIFKALLEYRHILKKEGALGKFIIKTVSGIKKSDENKENWLIVQVVEWAYAHQWTVSQDSPVFKRLSFTNSV